MHVITCTRAKTGMHVTCMMHTVTMVTAIFNDFCEALLTSWEHLQHVAVIHTQEL